MKRNVVLIVCALALVVGLNWTKASGFVVLPFVLLMDLVEGPIKAEGPPYATVQGIVFDRGSGAPLPGVSVVCISGAPLTLREHRAEVKTDAQGRYTLPILMDDFHIEVRKDGYVPLEFYRPPSEIDDIALVRAAR